MNKTLSETLNNKTVMLYAAAYPVKYTAQKNGALKNDEFFKEHVR